MQRCMFGQILNRFCNGLSCNKSMNVSSHLEAIGVKLECALNLSVTPREVDAAQKKIGLPLPDTYVQFITNFSNGLQLSWDAGRR